MSHSPEGKLPVIERAELIKARSPLLAHYLQYSEKKYPEWMAAKSMRSEKYEDMYNQMFGSWEMIANGILENGIVHDIFYPSQASPEERTRRLRASGDILFMGYEIGQLRDVACLVSPVTRVFERLSVTNKHVTKNDMKRLYDFVTVGLRTGAAHSEQFNLMPHESPENPEFTRLPNTNTIYGYESLEDIVSGLDIDDFPGPDRKIR